MSFAPANNELYIDEQGRLAVAVEFGKGDADDRAQARMEATAGVPLERTVAVNARNLVRHVALFDEYGAAAPKDLTDAVAVWNAVDRLTFAPEPADVMALAPDEVEAAIDAMAHREATRHAVEATRKALTIPAATRLAIAMSASVPVALSAIRDRFNDAAERFLDAYSVVRGCSSIMDAANRDIDGSTVTAWHRAKAAAQELDELVRFPLALDVYYDGSSRGLSREDPERRYTIGADVANASGYFVVDPQNPTFKPDERHSPPRAPLGIWAYYADANARIALPNDLDDWADRTADYLA